MLLIGELAEQVGLSASAIRYYEQIGLVQPVHRVSGRRVFDDESLGRLRAIRAARDAGFTLAEIRQLFDGQALGSPAWREVVRARIARLEARVRRLQAVAGTLRESLDCGCRAWYECPSLVKPGLGLSASGRSAAVDQQP